MIAGVGNVLRGDDGFGVEALHRLDAALGGAPGVELFESGIAGISLVQQLFDGHDALVLLDAADRGAAPGTLFVLAPDPAAPLGPQGEHEPVDLHQANPRGVLRMAAVLGVLPRRTWIVCCQAADCDELGADLSPAVRAALPAAVERVLALLREVGAAAAGESGPHCLPQA